jgi:hypothetical protein
MEKKLMKKKQVIALSTCILLALMIASAANITPALAKDLNLPYGADPIYYGNGGGTVEIAITPNSASTPLPTGYPPSLDAMRFKFVHVEMPNADLSFDVLVVSFHMKLTGAPEFSWQPFMVVTDNAEYAQLCETFYRGTLTQWNVPPNYPLQPAFATRNVQLVADDELSVVRHGNSVTVQLTAEQTLDRPIPVLPLTNPPVQQTFKFPAFSLELNKANGGSMHTVETGTLTGYTDASGYTYNFESMGFNANADLQFERLSTGQTLLSGATSNAGVAMNLIHTFYPPTS